MMNTSLAKKSEYEPTYTTLPDHLIEEHILTRLAVKPLIRFKCVSKGWLSMISSHKFAKTHFDLWFPSNDQTLIVQEERDDDTIDEDKYYLSFDENYNLNEFVKLRNKYPAFQYNTRSTCVVGSCNGLLCMYNEEIMRMYVWNPVTNHIRDTFGPVALNKLNDYEMRCVGFGYVSSIDDYKIGCLMFYKETLLILVFSLKTGLWTQKAKEKTYYELMLSYLDDTPAFVDNTIYWIQDRLDDEENYIIGLDLIEEDMLIIPLFVSMSGDWITARLFQMNGCLALCLIQNDNDDGRSLCKVWLMKEHGDEKETISWEKAIYLKYIGTNFVYLFDTGKCLVSKISHQSHRLMLHECSRVSSSKQEQDQEPQEQDQEPQEEEQDQDQEPQEQQQQQQLEQFDEGTVVWESVDRGSLFRYFTGVAWGYSESLISPFGPNLLEENQDG